MYCGLKSIIMVLLLGSSILALVAMISDYWIIDQEGDVHFGLYRGCNKVRQCVNVLNTDHSRNLLITVFVLGFFVFPCGILEVWYAPRGALGCLMYISVMSSLLAVLGFAAIINTVVVLRPPFPFLYSWSFAVAWMSVLTAIASAALSIYVRRVEPEDPLPEVQAENGAPSTAVVASQLNRFVEILKPT